MTACMGLMHAVILVMPALPVTWYCVVITWLGSVVDFHGIGTGDPVGTAGSHREHIA